MVIVSTTVLDIVMIRAVPSILIIIMISTTILVLVLFQGAPSPGLS